GSDWQGKVFVWDGKTGKPVGELEANPPTLTERVKRGGERLAALQTELQKAETARAAAETEMKAAREKVDQLKAAATETPATATQPEIAQATKHPEALAKTIAENSAKVTELQA